MGLRTHIHDICGQKAGHCGTRWNPTAMTLAFLVHFQAILPLIRRSYVQGAYEFIRTTCKNSVKSIAEIPIGNLRCTP